MTVNVSLCGSIPRSQMGCHSLQPIRKTPGLSFHSGTSDSTAGCIMSLNETTFSRQQRKTSISSTSAEGNQTQPPSWAVPAHGESRLEPVGGGPYSQAPVDLTTKTCFRFGRSQSSDVQLLHDTSSRRHAMIFHHPNGSCYVVDCGSAHGTYINGVRVISPLVKNSEKRPNIIPFRLKKGALIRFGGPGAPTFILKSFSVCLESVLQDVKDNKDNVVVDEDSIPAPHSLYTNRCNNISNKFLVKLNTRLNAMGRASMKMAAKTCLPFLASARLNTEPLHTPFLKKRSLSTYISRSISSDEDHIQKKRKALSCNESERVLTTNAHFADVAIISPFRSKRCYSFNPCDDDRPVVSPNPLDGDGALELNYSAESNLMVPLSLTKRKRKKVKFSDKSQFFYPPSVTPDDVSDIETEDKI